MKQGLGDWERKLNKAGQAFGMKAVDAYGPIFEAVLIGREHGVENWLGFRFTKAAGKVTREVPNYDVDPKIDAAELCQEVIDKLPPEFDKSVWLEAINEPRAQNKGDDTMFGDMNACDYLGEWCLAAAKFMNAKGYKFMGPGFNSGEPGLEGAHVKDAVVQYSQPGMLNFLRYSAAHPDEAALAIHEYSWSNWKDGQTSADWYPNLWGRFEAAIAAADLNGIPRTFPIFVTEFGFAHRESPSGSGAHSYLNDRNRMTARFPQLKYDAAWSLQEGWGSIDAHVNSWMKYDAGKEFDAGQQPAATHAFFGSTLPGAKPSKPLLPEDGDEEEAKPVTGTEPGSAEPGSEGSGAATTPADSTTDAGSKRPVEAAAMGEVSRQSIRLSPKAGINAVRLEVRRRDGDQWRLQMNMTQMLDGESRVDIVYISGDAGQAPSIGAGTGETDTTTRAPTMPRERVLGMDIAYVQKKNIDFQKAAEAGVRFVFIRAGSGRTKKDANFEHNYARAAKAGMLRGIYYYQYPESKARVGMAEDRTPEGQARHFISLLEEDAELGAVLDVEEGDLTAGEVKRFVDEFQKHDPYDRPITIYTRASFWNNAIGTGEAVAWAAKHPLWVAHHTSSSRLIEPSEKFKVAIPKPWRTYAFFQWTAVGGSRAGQKSNSLDLNYFTGSEADLKVWGRDVVPKAPEEFKIIGVKFVTSNLWLREGRSTDHKKIKLMPKGTQVEVIEEGDWNFLKVGNDTGYSSKRFLKADKPDGTPSAAAGPYKYKGPAVKFFTGLHGPADDAAWNRAGFKGQIERLNLPLVFMSNGINPDFSGVGDPARNVIRLYWNPRKATADEAYVEIRDDQLKRWWEKGYKRFIFFNEPQLKKADSGQSEEGMGIAWNSADEFARYLKVCLTRANKEFKGIHLYTTPVTSNEAFDPWGWRDAIWKHNKKLVKGWCMHAYSGNNTSVATAVNEILDQVKKLQRRYKLQIPVIVSEASVNRGDDAGQKAQVVLSLAKKAGKIRGLESVYWYAADWDPSFDVHNEGWFRKGIAEAYLQQRG
jgi:GH25 family lysozyme M1 (1,4-beta-N-acetylmuramidase)